LAEEGIQTPWGFYKLLIGLLEEAVAEELEPHSSMRKPLPENRIVRFHQLRVQSYLSTQNWKRLTLIEALLTVL
jgi:hypothetical protein